MEFGSSADIELPLATCSIGAGQEFPECCTRYQQKIFALKQEKQKEQNRHRRLVRCTMAESDKTAKECLATKDSITRLSGGSVSSSISYNDGEKHVHFGDEIVVQECSIDRLHRNDPNESAMDMIEAYKRECATMRIKPISKLLEQLAKLDQLSTPIDTLDLKNCRLDNRSCEALEAVLSRMQMTTLDLERTGLEDDGMIALCEMVEFYECASRLNFTGSSKVRARAWFFLGKMLKKVSFIEMVDVRQCALDEQALTSMLRAVRANCTLSILHLEGNNLTGKGVFILMAAMKFNENLKELYLGGNRIAPEDCQNIGNILRTNHTLTHLDLRDNSIQNAGLRCVCAGIAEQQVGLLSLNIATNGITPEGMHHIAVMLPCTKSLQEINLSNNRVGDYGIMMAKLSLLANRSLLKLVLCNTRITCEGAIALAEFVAESRMLEQLDLRDNDIRIAGLMALSLAHKMNFKLHRLTMPRTIKIEPRDKDMARNLIDKIDEYTARNMKEYQERQRKQQQQQDEAAAAAAAINEAEGDLDKPDSPPPRTAAELEEEERLISALKTESSEPTEDPFSSEDIIDNPEANPGKNLERALDSLILITKGAESPGEDDSTFDGDELAAADPSMAQQKSLNVDLLSDSSGNNNTAPLLNASRSDPIITDSSASSDSPTLPDLLGESPPKNQPSLESSEGSGGTLQQNANIELNTKPDLMLGDNLTSAEMPLDIASNVSYPPLDLLSNEDTSSQLVDVTQGMHEGDLSTSANEGSLNTNPTPDVSQVGQSQHVGITVDLVDGHNTSVRCSTLQADNTNTRNVNNDNGQMDSKPL